MSIEALDWALNVPVGGNTKVVLLGLANHAHPDGTDAYPSLDTLARYAHCDRSTARRNVRKLVDAGWIQRDGDGPRGQAKYRLLLHREGWQNATGSDLPPGHGCHPGGGTSTQGGVAPAPPEPSIEPSSKPFDDEEEEARESDHARVVDELAELLIAAARGRTTFEAIEDRERELRGAIAAYWDRKPDTDAVTDRWEEEQRRLSLAFGGWTVAEAEADDERRRERASTEQAALPLEAAVA